MSGKRANIFGQGRPERPYDERDDDAEAPQRATAAQLATRKIKPAKRRPGAAASTPSQLAQFGTPLQTGFDGNFASTQSPSLAGGGGPGGGGHSNNNTNPNGNIFGGGGSIFGAGATTSFPPPQQPAQGNPFANTSFPPFAQTSQNQGSGFNPQPPSTSAFNFTSGNAPTFNAGSQAPMFNGSNNSIFAPNGAPPTNGNTSQPFSQGFGGGSVFTSQPTSHASNMFGGQSQSHNSNGQSTGTAKMSGTSSSSSGGGTASTWSGMFSHGSQGNNGMPQSGNMFGSNFSTPQASNRSNQVDPGFTFGAQNSIFNRPDANAQNSGQAQQDAPHSTTTTTTNNNNNSNGIGQGTSAQPALNATATSGGFNFGSNLHLATMPTTTAPSSNVFGSDARQDHSQMATAPASASSIFGTSTATSSAPASNPFSSLATAGASSAPSFTFGSQTPQAQEKVFSNPFSGITLPEDNNATPKATLFGSVKASTEPVSTSQENSTPRPNLFASLAKPPVGVTPTSTPGSGLKFFGAVQKDSSSQATEQPSVAASETPKTSMFTGFSMPQTAMTQEGEKSQASISNTQTKPGNGIFAQGVPAQTPTFTGFKSQVKPAAEPLKETTTATATTATSNPFSGSPAPSVQHSSMFAPSKEPASASSPSMPNLTGISAPSDSTNAELPKIPKAHVPKEWTALSTSLGQNSDDLYQSISTLTVQLQQLNDKYRSKLMSLSPSADWSALSLWHHQHSSAIKTRIDIAKKQRAAVNGITGTESILSTKRKVDESHENEDSSPLKRARPTDPSATPIALSTTATPKAQAPATATSSLFAKAINSKPLASAESSTLFAPKAASASAPEPSKPAFGFVPSTPSTTASSSAGFKPTTAGGSSGFTSQFAAKAKTYEQLAAERKKKAMEEDYDSDEETKAQWSARYDKEEAERIAKQKEAATAVSGFTMSVAKKPADTSTSMSTGFTMPTAKKATNTTAPPSGFTMPAAQKTADSSASPSNPFAKLTKPVSGAATPGLFGSRAASPAPSTGGSVFNTGNTAQSSANNIFGHLSSAASSNHQEESEEEGEQAVGSVEPNTPPKRKFGVSETEADDSNDDTSRYKKQDTQKGSLLSRMTRDEGSESEVENNKSTAATGQTNGSTTPAGKPRNFFDFGAAAKASTTPKSDTFGGDQTYKEGTPIKFGNGTETEKKTAPSFQFTTSTTPSKPPPANPLFKFGSTTSGSSLLAPSAGLSAPSSAFSSRAATPSEAETSVASAAEDDDESSKLDQVDLSKLTAEERSSFDVIFETEIALAKHQIDHGNGNKTWENFARGPLYILKDKVTGKCFVRIRIASGATPLNYSILPSLKTSVMGSSGKMVMASMPKKEGGIGQIYVSFKTGEDATAFSEKYNASLPS